MNDSTSRAPGLRWLVGGLLLVGLVIGATILAKYRLIEPMSYASACERHEGPWLGCMLRQALVVLFVKNIAGMASTLFGAWSTVTRTRGLALAAIAMGGVSIVLYRFDAAVVGVLLGLLVVAREAARGYQQAQGEGQGEPRQA
jgi:hypothetical protein